MRYIICVVCGRLVIRIRCDAENAQCPLGIKFGCDAITEAPRLLKLAAVLGLEVNITKQPNYV